MGGSSKNRSGETRQATDSTMNRRASGRTDNSVLMGQQRDMQNGILGIVMPIMEELIGSGLSLFGMNPNMPKGTQTPSDMMPDIVTAGQPGMEDPMAQQQQQMPQSQPQGRVPYRAGLFNMGGMR